MPSYRAPVQDTLFVLNEVLGKPVALRDEAGFSY